MKRSSRIVALVAVCSALSLPVFGPIEVHAEDAVTIQLPVPRTEGGKPLMQALKERKSLRSYDTKELSLQELSDMLWAACGVNRPGSGMRTAPSAKNMQEIDVYVAKADGLYLYNAGANTLQQVLKDDIRALTGKQDFVKNVPVALIFVADLSKMQGLLPQDIDFYAATDTGYISQNVYLYCASEGLATVVLGWVDKPALAKAMKLGPGRKVVLTQPVGHPKE